MAFNFPNNNMPFPMNNPMNNPMNGMGIMNPNFGMQDQMNLNNNLMNFIQMNPNFFPMNNPNQMASQTFMGQMNNMGTGVKGGSLPRPNQQTGRIIQNIDSYPGYLGPRINVIFEISTGIKINIPAPPTETVNGLLIKFCERVGVNPILLKKELICIYNAIYIDPKNTKSIQSFFQQNMGLNDQAKIIVIDAQNIIGA